MDKNNENETIGMLLDIDHLYGEHSGRMAPYAAVLAAGAIPTLLYIYMGLYNYIPIWLFVIIVLIIIVRAIMIFPGREGYRLDIFKRRLHSEYTETADMMNIKTIHQDGCIEYINGKIMYLVICFNGTTEDDVLRSMQLHKLLESMIGKYDFDTYIQNVNDAPALREYYNKVKSFERNTSAKNFIAMIDHSLELTESSSIVMATIYAIKGTRSDWKDIQSQINSALNSRLSRCYKMIYRVTDEDDINNILNRDVDSVVNIPDLLRRKYATDNFATSRVLAYDLPEDKEILQGVGSIDSIIPKQTKRSFHVAYKEDKNV